MHFMGSLILNFIGGTVRYVYGTVWRTLLKKRKFTFDEYINGPKKSQDFFDQTGHGLVNGIVGIISLSIICWIIIRIGV